MSSKSQLVFGLWIALMILVAGCSEASQDSVPRGEAQITVEIIANGLKFEAPTEAPSGWITFRFANRSSMEHFALIYRMPEGTGIAAQQAEVAPIFQQGMDLLSAGAVDSALSRFGSLPEWFGQIVFTGGPGLASPGTTVETTLFLEPGTYLIECYVKTNGIFHSYNPSGSDYGMVHELTITEPTAPTEAPSADAEIRISSELGIEFGGDLPSGPITVAVHFDDQTGHENFVGHDVHLVKLADDTDMDRLASWMDWTQSMGLEAPAPATFLGGTNEMPTGSTAYLKLNLEPGRYAWVAEVPNPATKGMLREFTVE